MYQEQFMWAVQDSTCLSFAKILYSVVPWLKSSSKIGWFKWIFLFSLHVPESSNKFIAFPWTSSWLRQSFSNLSYLYRFQKRFRQNKLCCFTSKYWGGGFMCKLVEVDTVIYLNRSQFVSVNGHNTRIFQNESGFP